MPAAALRLVVDGRSHTFDAVDRVLIGRGTEMDVDLAHPDVSRLHAVLERAAAGWTLTDLSRNGTYLDGRRISELTVATTTTVRLGSPQGMRLTLIPADDLPSDVPGRNRAASAQGRLSSVHQVRTDRITIGRLPDNDVVLDDLMVSRKHAELHRTARGWGLTDLGSGNGTFVNGRRVDSALVTTEDVVGIGRALLHLQGDRLVTYVDSGDNAFRASGVTVITAEGRTMLHSVDLALPGRSLLAVIGPSGAGKSTLLAALVGTRPADAGEVIYAGRSLYADYDELRHRIALVPQDDVLHTQLEVREALLHAAQLRFPAGTTAQERQQRVEEVLAELGLTDQAEQCIASLSGGQRKRTSVALELLTKPSLLFLDEPTSGLDPGKDRSVMHTLRDLADGGRTVVVVTHNVANLEVCDRLLLLATGGWVAYFGPPAAALQYFEQPDFADIFLLLDTAPGEHWAQRFEQSTLFERDPLPDHTPGSRPARPPTGRAPRQQGPLSQLAVLCRRYVSVIASDRQYVLSLAALPLVLSLLARAVPGSAGLSASRTTAEDLQPGQLLLVLVVGAVLMGSAASVRELVKEREIYRRERAIGLSLGAYFTSKVLVLGVVTSLQAIVFTVLSLVGRNSPDDPLILTAGHLEILVAVLAVTVTSMLIGLGISAVIANADRGMPPLVLVVMVQLVFSGGLFPVSGRPVLEQLAWLAPSRWAFGMGAATIDLPSISRGEPDPLWNHSVTVWWASALVLAGMSVALAAFCAHRLARLDPQRRGRRR